MTTPPFSLLLPVYGGDRAAFLAESFRSSVHDQELRPDQVVLVQDGPVSAALAARIAELIAGSPVPVDHVVLPKNRGLAIALTQGLAHCSYDVIARMDADDIALPQRFARQLPVIAAGYDLVGTGMYEFDATGRTVFTRTPITGSEEIAKAAALHDPFNHPTVVYRKQAVLDAGGYQDLPLMEDYWLFARMIAAGARVENVPEPLVKYRVDAGAYARRGGKQLFRSELRLQRRLRDEGMISTTQYWRNVAVRGGYRFVPTALRRTAYRLLSNQGRKPPA